LRSTAGLQPGSIIGKKYEILSEIGRGGMGVVYRARHLIWNEEKALKVLTTEGAGVQQGLKGLLAEAQVMRKLQHPHIVRVEDVDYTEDGQPFVVMEYVEGQSLRQRIQDTGTLETELALRIAAETCSALSAAHQKGIIHRDIKPQNLLLAKGADGSESVKVIDFGIAKVREEAGLSFTGMMTGTTGFFVGTPEYASPEQAQGMRGSELDGRTDLYSLGLVLYEMLTGRLPFAADSPMAVLVQRLEVQPTPPDQLRPDLRIPADASRVVIKALEKDREKRYNSAGEMAKAIGVVLESRRAERERQQREAAETARLAAAQAERERRAREEAERQKRERAEAARMAAARTDQDGQAQQNAKRTKREQPERQARRGDYDGTTRVKPARKHRSMLLAFGTAGAIALAAGVFIVHKEAQKPNAETLTRKSEARAPAPIGISSAPPDGKISVRNQTSSESTATTAVGSTPANNSAPEEPARHEPAMTQPIRVAANLQAAKLIRQPAPDYPPQAIQARVSGHVILDATIGKDGTVQDLRVASGHPSLVPAAMEAVKRWAYQPTLVGGKPVEVATQVDVNFTLTQKQNEDHGAAVADHLNLRARTNPKDGLAYVWIPPGAFQMGCSAEDTECLDDERPVHTVNISKGFWIGRTEVTQAAYQQVVGQNPSKFKGTNLPVETVTWSDATVYCRAVGMRLPTEAEWEYAARGGSLSARYGHLDSIAWYASNAGSKTHEVAQKEPNGYGLYDMLGNVWEWTADWYGNYESGLQSDPSGAFLGNVPVLRGGSWYDDQRGERASTRGTLRLGQIGNYGFRCAGQ
jgi:TonB family protein